MNRQILWWDAVEWTAIGTVALALATFALVVVTAVLIRASRRAAEAAERSADLAQRSAASSEIAAVAAQRATQAAEAGLNVSFSADYFELEPNNWISVKCEGARVFVHSAAITVAVFHPIDTAEPTILEDRVLVPHKGRTLPAEVHATEKMTFEAGFGPVDRSKPFKGWVDIEYSIAIDGERHSVATEFGMRS